MQHHWFLIRGLARESAHWQSFPDLFREAIPSAQVHCLDLPGTGRHYQSKTPMNLKSIVHHLREDYLKTLEKENIPSTQPRFILGLSLGGMVVARWLQEYPEDFKGAVLINSSLRGLSPFYKRLSPGAMRHVMQAFLAKDLTEREKIILNFTSNAKNWTSEDIKARVEVAQHRPMSKKNVLRQLVAAASDFSPKTKPLVPVLLLCSLGDSLAHPSCSSDIQKAWDATLRRHAWAGHDLPLDDPQWILEAIRTWMLDERFDITLPVKKTL